MKLLVLLCLLPLASCGALSSLTKGASTTAMLDYASPEKLEELGAAVTDYRAQVTDLQGRVQRGELSADQVEDQLQRFASSVNARVEAIADSVVTAALADRLPESAKAKLEWIPDNLLTLLATVIGAVFGTTALGKGALVAIGAIQTARRNSQLAQARDIGRAAAEGAAVDGSAPAG